MRYRSVVLWVVVGVFLIGLGFNSMLSFINFAFAVYPKLTQFAMGIVGILILSTLIHKHFEVGDSYYTSGPDCIGSEIEECDEWDLEQCKDIGFKDGKN